MISRPFPVRSRLTVAARRRTSQAAADRRRKNPGPSSTGLTDSEGVYVMKTINDEPGAVVGHHRVSITSNPFREAAAGDQDVDPVEERVPKRYNLLSELALDVPEGGIDNADFELTALNAVPHAASVPRALIVSLRNASCEGETVIVDTPDASAFGSSRK